MKITKINYKNELFDLGDEDVENVLEALEIDSARVDMESRNGTLYIMEKSGTKGADISSLNDKDARKLARENGISIPKSWRKADVIAALEALEASVDEDVKSLEELKEKIKSDFPKGDKMILIDGKLIYASPHFTLKELHMLYDEGKVVTLETPENALMEYRQSIDEKISKTLAEQLDISEDIALKVVKHKHLLEDL